MKWLAIALSLALPSTALAAERKTVKINPLSIACFSASYISFKESNRRYQQYLLAREQFHETYDWRRLARTFSLSLAFASLGMTAGFWGSAIAIDYSKDVKRVEIGWRFG